ncbi:HNH endonuclease signature motif containing protein [Streptomyces sp. NPDC007162]|uniref:HNH endonuclease signature motif containing protein n=1 Tax=Streptomyces sp. NPDC007162 TaxID=3156917 RepID=UPI0033ECA82F
MSDFSPGAPLCKLLFGRATSCAYPDCSEPLVEEHRGLLSINVEVAHIRAEKAGGPRFDVNFTEVNSEPNLVLLCHKHHKWVDRHPDAYPTEELLTWKECQAVQSRGGGLSADQLDQVVKAFTTPKAEAEAVGIISAGGENIVSKIEYLAEFKLLNADTEARYLGVRITNVGAIGFGVDAVGYEIDIHGPAPLVYGFPAEHIRHRPPRRLEPQANTVWLIDPDVLCNGIRLVMQTVRVYVPVRFRAFCHLGSGGRVLGPWVSALHLPIWKDHISQEWLDGFAERAEQTRAKLRPEQ